MYSGSRDKACAYILNFVKARDSGRRSVCSGFCDKKIGLSVRILANFRSDAFKVRPEIGWVEKQPGAKGRSS